MEDDEPLLPIGELARRAGVPVRTIRFWSDAGVLPPAARYTPALEWLIAALRAHE